MSELTPEFSELFGVNSSGGHDSPPRSSRRGGGGGGGGYDPRPPPPMNRGPRPPPPHYGPPPGAYAPPPGAFGPPPPMSSAPGPPPHRGFSGAPRPYTSPLPPGAPRPVYRTQGGGIKIPPKADPVNSYRPNMVEKASASAGSDPNGLVSGVLYLVLGILAIAAVSSVFVIPDKLKPLWLVVVGTTLLVGVGMVLYKALMDSGEEEGMMRKYATMVLYALTAIYSAVMAGALLFMAWSLYGVAHTRSNLAKANKVPVTNAPAKAARDENEERRRR